MGTGLKIDGATALELCSKKAVDRQAEVSIAELEEQLQSHFEAIDTELDHAYKVFTLLGKLHCDDFYDEKADYHASGMGYGYITANSIFHKGSNSFEFRHRLAKSNGDRLEYDKKAKKYPDKSFKTKHKFEKPLAISVEKDFRRLRAISFAVKTFRGEVRKFLGIKSYDEI